MNKNRLAGLSIALMGAAVLFSPIGQLDAQEAPRNIVAQRKTEQAPVLKPTPESPEKRTLVEPKPLSDSVKTGLEWLAKNQKEDGSWSQGEESAHMGLSGEVAYQGNVADSCIAILALYRAGSTPAEGPYKDHVSRGIEYVIGQIEASDDDSLYVTDVRGTRVQSKIGTYVDTFLANLMLAELKGTMGTPQANEKLELALNKVVTKIENHQNQSGSWDNEGWAPVLTQSIAAKGLNRARQAGVDVDEKVLDQAQNFAVNQVDPTSGKVRAEGAAGVSLYAVSANVASMQERANTNAREEKDYRDKAQNAPTAEERQQAQKKLERIVKDREANEAANQSTVAQLKDPSFVSGFGSNGGEEFLSYMNISEALVAKGGQEWQEWDQAMNQNLSRIQNPDGSWSGHHCITGKTFCTATALLVMTADRMTLAKL